MFSLPPPSFSTHSYFSINKDANTTYTIGCEKSYVQANETIKQSDVFKRLEVESGLRPKVLIVGDLKSKATIFERMELYRIPGVSITVINEGKIAWSAEYGSITHNQKSGCIDAHTLFQAGSISKPITAFGALLLVQRGEISLDDDVNLYLKRWKIPENEYTKVEKVTLRRLLSHTAGTNVQGFPGYSSLTSFPTILDVLDGIKPFANTDPVRVIFQPGTQLKYSGGGTTIVQLLIEDITGEPFDFWMEHNVLKPLGMLESTFQQPLPSSYASCAAYGHCLDGAKVEDHWHVYPEKAAAGLWSTSKDLALFILYIQSALKGEKTNLLDLHYVKEMTTRQEIRGEEIHSSLGLFLENEGKNLVFGHGGQDNGFIARLYGYAYNGHGLVVMMNNDTGWNMMNEIRNSVADAYSWPNFQPIEKVALDFNISHLACFAGEYVVEDKMLETMMIENQLFIDFKEGLGPHKLFATEKNQFFIQEDDVTIEFFYSDEHLKSLSIIDSKLKQTIFKMK
jgi:CubicO group peptidase (beta-lactamase class C family)